MCAPSSSGIAHAGDVTRSGEAERAEIGTKRAPVAFGERIEPGSLAWVRSAEPPAPEDRLVRTAFQFLVDPAGLAPGKARELGRAIGAQARADELADHLDAFSHLGIGRLTFAMFESDRYLFHGIGLRGSESPNAPACALTLGFLEGVVGASTGHAALGAEMTCQSRGDERCTFTIRARP